MHLLSTRHHLISQTGILGSQIPFDCDYHQMVSRRVSKERSYACRKCSFPTSSSTTAKRPRNALWLSVVSFSSVIPRAQSFIVVTSASDLLLRTIKCCSVVFDVTLRLLVINTSSSSPVKNKRHRLSVSSVINFPRSVTAVCIAFNSWTVTACDGAIRYIACESQFLPTPSAFDAPVTIR